MQSVLEEILTGFVEMYTIMRDCEFVIWTFHISLFNIFISLLVLEFILAVIFPHFMSDDDD